MSYAKSHCLIVKKFPSVTPWCHRDIVTLIHFLFSYVDSSTDSTYYLSLSVVQRVENSLTMASDRVYNEEEVCLCLV